MEDGKGFGVMDPFKINIFSVLRSSLSAFLKKVGQKRHPSRIASLSRSFGMTFSFFKNKANAKCNFFLLEYALLSLNIGCTDA